MNIKRTYNKKVFLALCLGLLNFSCSKNNNSPQALVKTDGSSTVFPITEAIAEEYMKKNSGAKITIGISGTGGGFKKFCAGKTYVNNASRPIKSKEIKLCASNNIEYLKIPVAYDGITVVINPKNTWATKISTKQLKLLWKSDSKISKWNDLDPSWPDRKIKLYGPGPDSGTFDYFTKAINGKSGLSRSHYSHSEDDNMLVHGVSNDVDALGYFGYAYYVNNKEKVKAAAISHEGSPYIDATEINILKNNYKPLSRPIYIYVNKTELSQNLELKNFISFYLNNVSSLVKQVGYVTLNKKTYEEQLTNLELIKPTQVR